VTVTLPAPLTRFLSAIADRDADAVAECFTSDAVYAFAVPHPPVAGREAIRTMFAGLLDAADQARWDVVTSVTDGERVWIERVDRFWFDGREVPIECVGIVELDGDRIRAVRDYVDLQSWRTRRESA
jgi:limonene-1,2-epoxide hydrolase